jgi:fluoroquinolone resistance protein
VSIETLADLRVQAGLERGPLLDERITALAGAGELLHQLSVEGCVWTDVDLQDAAVAGCEFVECRFEGCNLSNVRLSGSRLLGCTFVGCKLVGLDWTRLDTPAVDFYHPTRFEDCDLSYSSFCDLRLVGGQWIRCVLRGADFSRASLDRAVLVGSDCDGARFDGSSLRGADLRGATRYRIDVRQVPIDDARFSLPDAVHLLEALPLRLEPWPDST